MKDTEDDAIKEQSVRRKVKYRGVDPEFPVPLDIVIPVYNEDEVISRTLAEVDEKVSTPHRIIIVYDFDEDSTLPVVNEYVVETGAAHIQLVRNQLGPGVLNAIKAGFREARAEAVLVVMGDASDDLVVVDDMVAKIRAGFDIVCGSRYAAGGRQIGGPLVKKLLSKTAGVSLHLITGIPTRDVTNSFKLYRTELVKSIEIESRGGFEIGLEILVKAFIAGRRITEVPSTWRDRSAGTSKFKLLKWLPHYLIWYWLAVKFKLGLSRPRSVEPKRSGSP